MKRSKRSKTNGQECLAMSRCSNSKSVRDLLRIVRKMDQLSRSFRYKGKKGSSMAHSEKRARQRFGIALSSGTRQAIEEQIRYGGALSLFKQSSTKHHYAVVAGGTIIPIVWDRARKVIVTVLPPDALKPYAELIARHWNGYILPLPFGSATR